jgi:hypothetical protein
MQYFRSSNGKKVITTEATIKFALTEAHVLVVFWSLGF